MLCKKNKCYLTLFQTVTPNILSHNYLIDIVQTQIYMKLVEPDKIQNHLNFEEYLTVKQIFFLYQPILS